MSLAGYKRAHGPSLEACLRLQCICIVWLLLNLTCTTITCQLLVCYTPLKVILPNMSSETLNSKSLVEVCIALYRFGRNAKMYSNTGVLKRKQKLFNRLQSICDLPNHRRHSGQENHDHSSFCELDFELLFKRNKNKHIKVQGFSTHSMMANNLSLMSKRQKLLLLITSSTFVSIPPFHLFP